MNYLMKFFIEGDSGGGLYYYDTNLTKFVVVGITSFGHGCANAFFPGYLFIYYGISLLN